MSWNKKSDLLYNQCLNSKFKNNYCVKCYKQSVQNSNDLPRFGDITNRGVVRNISRWVIIDIVYR